MNNKEKNITINIREIQKKIKLNFTKGREIAIYIRKMFYKELFDDEVETIDFKKTEYLREDFWEALINPLLYSGVSKEFLIKKLRINSEVISLNNGAEFFNELIYISSVLNKKIKNKEFEKLSYLIKRFGKKSFYD